MGFGRNFCMNILVIGSRGNLGTEFTRMVATEFEIFKGSNNPRNKFEFRVIPSVGILSPMDLPIDLIINFANAYFHRPDSEQYLRMHSSIVGVAEAIRVFNSHRHIPAISFASYFQFAPKNLQPWSDYSLLKDEASAIYNSMNSAWFEVVLRDNFGGTRRNKFFDSVLEANYLGRKLDATEGNSLINLIHVQDICEYLLFLVRQINSGVHIEPSRVEIRSKKSHSLKELVALVDKNRGISTKVHWGSLPYRDREVFQDWESAPIPTSWTPRHSLEDYVRNYRY
jgi:hypothetical protein